MSIRLGLRLKIRAMIHVAAEPIPFFWPMRTFIHHNPLHGLEHLPFDQAARQGAELFHGRAFLPRRTYQGYLAAGKVDRPLLSAAITRFLASREEITGIDLQHWLTVLMTEVGETVTRPHALADIGDLHGFLHNGETRVEDTAPETLKRHLHDRLLGDRPVYEAVDALYGTEIGTELDELMIKSCLDFFDEGQSVWDMPGRERGLFAAWRDMANRNVPFYLHGLHVSRILEQDEKPEGVIAHVLEQFGVPEDEWINYFTRELARLHGWAGFVKWRSSAQHYYWAERFPGDLVDFVAIRLATALALLRKDGRHGHAWNIGTIAEAIETRTAEIFLRHELHTGQVLPAMAHAVDQALLRGKDSLIQQVLKDYLRTKALDEAQGQGTRMLALAETADTRNALLQLSESQLGQLLTTIAAFEQQEGMIWLCALEAHAIHRLLNGFDRSPPPVREKRPFAQALFCIDTRSERIRRHLEDVGDYQTFGIAGFFGVPVSFMELGKGSETHLCPVILTPKNLVPEITAATRQDAAVTALEKAMHELKESVLTPFVTVEAIGLLFGFDMIGKTIAPRTYNRWRKRLRPEKPFSRLLLDKLSREQADSIVRAVQRAVIVQAVEQELGLPPEQVTDDMVRSLRESALGHETTPAACAEAMQLDAGQAEAFIERLRTAYRINEAFAHQQLERLGRIGFTVDEQVAYVVQALSSIGLTEQFSRFVLLVGHGSSSENNPYESALDCGACGGNQGLVSAKVLAQMANNRPVRRILRARGIDIPDDTWFLPAFHDTTTDEIHLENLQLIPPSHLVYIDRLRNGLTSASRLCAAERVPTLGLGEIKNLKPAAAYKLARRNAMDWSQVRPEWGLSRNVYFVIGRRHLTAQTMLHGRAFLHSYDYRIDPKQRLLENILTGPLVVGQWINMEHYFSTVDNERFGSGSKVNHNVAGRFGVMTGNLSDLRTGLPSQTVLKNGSPYHEPMRLITVIEAPFEHARKAIDGVVTVKNLVQNAWIRLLIVDPESGDVSLFEDGVWQNSALPSVEPVTAQESILL